MTTLSPELLDELNVAITDRHLDSVADEIRNNAAECHALVASSKDVYASVGNTRFGGDPDLPVNIEWPTDPGSNELRHPNFIAQINFAEIPKLPNDNVLPSSGMLYVFVRLMDCAAAPVVLDTIFYDGDLSTLRRRRSPPEDTLCVEYLVGLLPQKIRTIPSISIASFRKTFGSFVAEHTEDVDGNDGEMRRIYLSSDMRRKGEIGQLLGFANTGDEQENLYRQVVLARLGKRQLVFNDYWDSMAEYEAYIEEWKDDKHLANTYRDMRDGVSWLMSNRDMIARVVDEWRLLFRIDSNYQMNLNINDADPLYVVIRHEELASSDFSNLAGEVTQG